MRITVKIYGSNMERTNSNWRTKMNRRMLIITRCEMCPSLYEVGSNETVCGQTDKHIEYLDIIPNFCPLPQTNKREDLEKTTRTIKSVLDRLFNALHIFFASPMHDKDGNILANELNRLVKMIEREKGI
jgi:hypothetical protein